MRWFDSDSTEELHEALLSVAPGLAELPITPRGLAVSNDPNFWSSSARLGDDFIVKYAWSQAAAARRVREARVLSTLAGSHVPFVPEVRLATSDPVLLVTRRVAGSSLFEVIDDIDRARAGAQLAAFLAALHAHATSDLLAGVVPLTTPTPQATTAALRSRFGGYIRPGQRSLLAQWCDWTDDVLSIPAETVVVHGDFHGDNQLWDGDRLRLVFDFETVARADPEYDLRCLAGTGPGVELLVATARDYELHAERPVSMERVMAWHVRTALGDALWRTEAGFPLPDHRTPPEWVDDVAERFAELGIDTALSRTGPPR